MIKQWTVDLHKVCPQVLCVLTISIDRSSNEHGCGHRSYVFMVVKMYPGLTEINQHTNHRVQFNNDL